MTSYNKDNVNNTDKNEWTPLYSAIIAGDNAEVEKLLKVGANPNQLITIRNVVIAPLAKAVKLSHNEIVKTLLEYGADVKLNNYKALFHVIGYDKQELLKLLLSYLPKGTNLTMKDPNGYTPLCISIINNDIDVAEILLPFISDISKEIAAEPNIKEFLKENMKEGSIDAARWNKILNILNGTMYGKRR